MINIRQLKLTDAHVKSFWQKVNKTDQNECWEWTGGKNDQNYGYIKVDYNAVKAHRLSYFLHHNLDPGKLLVRHSCDNPSCVNPNHLKRGTQQQNMDDLAKSRKRKTGNEVPC